MSPASSRVRPVVAFLIAALLCQYGGVRAYAAQAADRRQASAARERSRPPAELLGAGRFEALLAELREVLRREEKGRASAGAEGFSQIERLGELRRRLEAEDENIREYFSRLGSQLGQKRLPAEVLQRHAELARGYESKYAALAAHLDGIEGAHQTATGFMSRLTGRSGNVRWDEVLEPAITFLTENAPPTTRRRLDPHNLSHRSLKAEGRGAPRLTRDEWLKSFAPASKSAQRPAAGAKNSAAATAPLTPDDLAETVDMRFTPEIRQLAESLGRNPVKIYNWVRNSIEFTPTWGSIQGAQHCLETRVCNAFDTASLLIALLRVSGVPARYQMGTIEVPVGRFMNWAGGFTDPDAAASLFAGGGIPSVVRRVDQSGRVASVRLEHVWAKTFVDYAPSGGAVPVRGDTWVELDASYKQHSFFAGVDFEAVAPSNLRAMAEQLTSTATVDPATGLVTGIDSAAVRSWLQQAAARRVDYVRANLPGAPLRDVIGGRALAAQSLAVLPVKPSYTVLARADAQAQLPDSLRHRITLALGSTPQDPSNADLFTHTASLPEVAGKSVLLLYAPATAGDEQLLHSAVTLDSAGGFDARPWPAFINLVPQLYIGEQLVAAGGPLRFGSPVVSQIAFSSPTVSTPAVSNMMLAGEAAAVGLDLQAVSPSQTAELIRKSRALADGLRQGSAPQGLARREFAEVLLSSNVLGWFDLVDQTNHLTSLSAGVVTVRFPSAGLFFAKHETHSLFGAPVSVSAGGFQMDIDRDLVISVARDGDAARAANLSFIQGTLGSAFEAQLPVTMLSAGGNQASGIATMQALERANEQGIPVYKINAANAPSLIPTLQIHADDLADIQDAINAGREVTVPRTPVDFNGQSVLGMVIKDPATGSASFLISGGSNGAIIAVTLIVILTLVMVAAASPLVAALGFILAAIVSSYGAVLSSLHGDGFLACFFTFFALGLAAVALLALLTSIPALLPILGSIGLLELWAVVVASGTASSALAMQCPD